MLKQSVIQEQNLADTNAGTHLPPLNNLPQWSRVNTLDKARYPKPFLKDRLQPLPSTSSAGSSHSQESKGSQHSGTMAMALTFEEHGGTDGTNPALRITHLERSLLFLQQQHHDILTNLHSEIDSLKRKNKDLQFKIISMSRQSSPVETSPSQLGSGGKRVRSSSKSGSLSSHKTDHAKDGSKSKKQEDQSPNTPVDTSDEESKAMLADVTDSHSQGSEEKLEELKVIFLEEEVKELKKTLREEKNKNSYLTQVLEQFEAKQKLAKHYPEEKEHQTEAQSAPSGAKVGPGTDGTSAGLDTRERLLYNATLDPLLIHFPGQPDRAPSITESEAIIKHLLRINDRQAHELNQLKSDLRDVLYSHKWTPDAYLLAKAYVLEDDAKEAAEKDRLPRVELKNQTRKLPDMAYLPRDTVTLPALKQTMGNKAIERRKRTQILQKARLRREFSGHPTKMEIKKSMTTI